MRVAIFGIGLAAAACQQTTPPPRAAPSGPSSAVADAAATPPRWFPRAPARVTMVGATDRGVVALHGAMRLLLRGDAALPDSAPHLEATGAAGTEAGGAPTGSAAASTLAVPERLGGGWLFVVGRELWHAPSWLDQPRRLFEFVGTPRVHLGLDSIVAQESGRGPFAFDVTGAPMPLSNWPASPAIADLAARDAKHAAVVADLRGLAVTEDGGRTWREIPSRRTPFGVRVGPGGYVVRGRNGGDERESTWRIDVHGELLVDASEPGPERAASRTLDTGAWERVIAQGYDDGAGRYVVLDHGLLEIYRKADGAQIERSTVGDPQDACRPIHWPSPTPAAAPGFACLGPRGTTLWRVGEREASEVTRLAGVRRVWSSEIGALAVEGPCEGAATGAMPKASTGLAMPRASTPVRTTTLCVWGRAGGANPTTVRLQGSSADDVVLPQRDGSVVVLRPPTGGPQARRAAEMFVDPGSPTAGTTGRVHGVPLQLGALKADVAAMLAEGHWRSDAEALDRGDVAVWVEHETRVVGLRIHPDGHVDVGPRSAGATVHRAAGLRSLSWSPGGASFESVDGGMHYTQIGLPAVDVAQPGASPKPPARTDAGCTAIGCVLPTLVRVGWGASAAGSDRPKIAPTTPPSGARLALACALRGRSNDEPKPTLVRRSHGPVSLHLSHVPSLGSLLATPFYGTKPPTLRGDQTLQAWNTVDLADKRAGSLDGRVYVWGSFVLGPDPDAGWQWRWYDPRARAVHATAVSRPPDEIVTQHQAQGGRASSWSVVTAADPRRGVGLVSDGTSTSVFALVEGEAPSRIEREDGAPFGVLEAAVAAPGDRTLLAGAVGDPAGTAVYVARGARAERVALVPRVGVQGKPSPALLGLHTDGVRVAIAVEDHDVPARLDAAFYLREAYPTEGPIRRYTAARTLRVCTANGAGFEAWAKLELGSDIALTGSERTVHLQGPTRARLRFGDDGSLCVAELTSDIDGEGATLLATLPAKAGAVTTPLTVGHGGRHYALACTDK